MDINNLPEELRALALLRAEKPSRYKNFNKHDERLNYMFDWQGSLEGYGFWMRAYDSNYTTEDINYAAHILNIESFPQIFN